MAASRPPASDVRPQLIGLPYDASSSFLRGAAEAPPLIREALWSPAGNAWTETGMDLSAGARPATDGPVYVSVDLDGLDPAFAPGVSHREPGGLSVRDVITLIHAIPGPIIGADVVEYNPRQDLGGVTAAVAAKIVKEIAGQMIQGHG